MEWFIFFIIICIALGHERNEKAQVARDTEALYLERINGLEDELYTVPDTYPDNWNR
jgi:hypothetical protein